MNRAVTAIGVALLVMLPAACGSGGDSTNGNNSGSTGGNVYYYCWDNGAAVPHHYGHQTSGDHLCSQNELTDAGCTDDGPTAAGNEYWSC